MSLNKLYFLGHLKSKSVIRKQLYDFKWQFLSIVIICEHILLQLRIFNSNNLRTEIFFF